MSPRLQRSAGAWRLGCLCAAVAFSPCLDALRAAEPWPAEAAGINITASGLLPGTEQVSGAVWNPADDRLYVVDDNSGRISSLAADGTGIASWSVSVADHDHEALTFADFASPNVYVGVEQGAGATVVRKVRKFLLQANHTAALQQEWILTEMNTGAANLGLESLTFVPDAFLRQFPDATGAPYNEGKGSRFGSGGLFFAGLQANGTVYVYDLDIVGNTTNSVFVRKFAPVSGRGDLAELGFDRSSGLLYCLWDGANRLAGFVLPSVAEPAGHIFREWDLWAGGATRSDEGFAIANTSGIDGQSRVFFCDDFGENVWRFDQWPAPPVVTITATDADAGEFGANPATFTVTRTGPTNTKLSVRYSLGGTAVSGVDYAALPGTITMAAGVTSATITLTPLADALAEGDETLTLTLTTPEACSIGVAAASATAILHDRPMDAWRSAHFSPAEREDPAISGDNADPDGDGLVNLLEYAVGFSPRSAHPAGAISAPQILGGFLALTFRRPRPAPPDLIYGGATAADPAGPWVADALVAGVIDNHDGTETVTLRDSVPASGASRRFLRLTARRAP